MNEFKKQLQETTTKFIDEKINGCIVGELKKLEDLAEIEEYKEQIRKRREGITNILSSFDYNMEIIKRQKKCQNRKKVDELPSYIRPLDKIIAKRLNERLEREYQNTLVLQGQSKIIDKELVQILDRQLAITELLGEYDENIQILDEYNRTHQLEKTQIII